MTNQPPREWMIENFVHNKRIKYCTLCRLVPAVPLGRTHNCGGLFGLTRGGEWAEEEPELLRLHLVPNEDYVGGWYCVYDPPRAP